MRRWFLVSLGLHVVVIVAGAWLSHLTVTSPPTMDSITVGLAVAPAQAREPDPTPPPAAEPEPEPEPEPQPPAPLPEPEPEPEPVVETPEPEPTPPPVPAEIERPEREPVPDRPPAEEPERPVDLAPPDTDLPPPPPVTEEELIEPEPVQPRRTETAQAPPDTAPTRQELGAGAAVGATALSDVDDGYLVRVQQKIGRRWAPTPASALGQKYVTTVVSFRIRPDGQVEMPAVSESSGLSVFDRQALRAVIDASPLPPLPPRYPDGVHINFRFEYER